MQLTFEFGAAAAGARADRDQVVVMLPNPLIAGARRETWQLGCEGLRQQHLNDLLRWTSGPYSVMVGQVPVDAANIGQVSQRLYRQMLGAVGDLQVQRFWNFIPRINQPHPSESRPLDQYMAFCLGRAGAYEQLDAAADASPAASAVGTPGTTLTVVCLAAPTPVTPVENPLQTPAYRYDRRYGPKPPRFSRAALVRAPLDGLLVSGTASIRASESLHQGNVAAQLEVALANIEAVTAAAAAESHSTRIVRVYLRDPDDWARVQPRLDQTLLQPDVSFSIIQADICRPELLVEIETYAS